MPWEPFPFVIFLLIHFGLVGLGLWSTLPPPRLHFSFRVALWALILLPPLMHPVVTRLALWLTTGAFFTYLAIKNDPTLIRKLQNRQFLLYPILCVLLLATWATQRFPDPASSVLIVLGALTIWQLRSRHLTA